MFDIDLVISRLEALSEPSRPIDGQIAVLVGFEKKTVDVKDPHTGASLTRILWALPSGEAPAKVPSYTGSIDDAFQLARTLAPNNVIGCSWHEGGGNAVIDGYPNCYASTPAIALCVAALKFKRSQQYP